MVLTHTFFSSVKITLHPLIAASAVRFWWPSIFKNLENPYFENLEHLQKLVNLLLIGLYISHNNYKVERSYFRARPNTTQVTVKNNTRIITIL